MSTQKVKMYEITKELLAEKNKAEAEAAEAKAKAEGTKVKVKEALAKTKEAKEAKAKAEKAKAKEVTSIEVKESNGNNCKYFKKICDLLGVEADKFKKGKEFVFDYRSKENLKDIIKHYVAYSKVLKQKPNDRPVKTLNQLHKNFTAFLKNEITDPNELYSYLAKVEMITSNSVQTINHYLKEKATLNFKESINEEDNAVLHLYHLKEIELLQSKMKRIRELFSDIRSAEIAENCLKGHNLTASHQEEDSKIIISKVIAKQIIEQGVYAPKATKELTYEIAVRLGFVDAPLYDYDLVRSLKKEEKQVEEKPVEKKVSTAVKNKVIAELKEFLKSPETNENFRFETPKSYYDNKYKSPQIILNEAIQLYIKEQEMEPTSAEIEQIDLEELEQIIQDFKSQK